MKVLLVDDDEVERTALKNILKAQGPWEIVEAAGGQEAFDLLCDGLNPTACFFDIRMPKIDGHKLLSMVRDEPALKHLKVIITSSARDRDMIMSLGKLGISGYLLKPYEMSKTSSSLTLILGSAKATLPNVAAKNLLAKTALVVDDDELTRTTLTNVIQTQPGWEVVQAEDGLAALEHLRSGLRPDLGIFDLRMPRLDGQTLLARIREDPSVRKMPVLIVSGQQDRDQIRTLVQLRIAGYLLKPLDVEKTRATIEQTIRANIPAANGATPDVS
jgi:DNA-binding NarL/FixJ family response regulator